MNVKIVKASDVKADFALVGVYEEDDKRVAPGLKTFGLEANDHAVFQLGHEASSFAFGKMHSFPADGRGLLMIGLGKRDALTQEKMGTLLKSAVAHVKGMGFKSLATTLAADSNMDAEDAVRGLTSGAVIGELAFTHYKSEQPEDKIGEFTVQIVVDGKQATKLRKVSKDAAIMGAAVNEARLLANTPGNIATPAFLADAAKASGKANGFKVTVKGRSQLRKEKFGALCGVAQGSANEEKLIIMDYNPAGAKKTLAVVGKGVTFDSGGISIKPGAGMWDMKYDKCGACNTIALMGALKDLGVKHRVIGVVGAVENMPSGDAQRPGDIVTARDGTTIEVLNTDAEGRLVLADAISYTRDKFDPSWIVDMATLTGACDFAVGSTYVGAMSKNDELVQSFIAASRKVGDKAWQLPQGEEFDEANKGTYADLQNISLTNKAGTAIGGSFVSHFAKDTPFVHLDIASKAWTPGVDYFAKGPTGAGTRIVLQRILDE